MSQIKFVHTSSSGSETLGMRHRFGGGTAAPAATVAVPATATATATATAVDDIPGAFKN